MGNCRCDLASHLAQARRTIHVVMAAMRAMAVMVIKVFNIIVIAVLILCRRAGRLEVLQYVPRHHTEEHNQHKGDQHGGDYLASMRVMTKLCTVTMVTMHMTVSMRVFTVSPGFIKW